MGPTSSIASLVDEREQFSGPDTVWAWSLWRAGGDDPQLLDR
jgi:hypothetical protein